jgi:hypothetical protein
MLGWTMNQVREHTLWDIKAMNEVIEDEVRAAKRAQQRRR